MQIKTQFKKTKQQIREVTEAGIIIYEQRYRRHDKIIRVLTSSGILNLIAHGVNKMKSKNRYKINLFDEIRFSYFISSHTQKIFLLKRINSVIRSSVSVLVNFGCATIISDMIAIILANEPNNEESYCRVFAVLQECISYIFLWNNRKITNFHNFYMLLLLRALFVQFIISSCAACQQNKQIIALSFVGGGLICKQCAQQELIPKDKIIFMQLFRMFYQEETIHHIDKIIYEPNFAKWLCQKLQNFIANYFFINVNFRDKAYLW